MEDSEITLLVKTSRPVLWFLPPLIFVIGFFYFRTVISFHALIQLMLLSLPFSLFLYGINDVYDYESDKSNLRKGSIQGVILEEENHDFIKRISYVIIIILFTSSLITMNLSNIVSMILLLFFSYFYSAPPLRFKTKPFLDSLSNGVIYFFAPFALGASYSTTLSNLPLKVYWCSLATCAMHAYSTIVDYSVDKKAKDKTITVLLGKRLTALLITVILLLTFFFSSIQTLSLRFYILFTGLLSLITFFKPDEKLASFFSKIMVLVFMIISLLYLNTKLF